MRENRKNNETREIKFTHGYTKHAPGSILAEFGETKVIVTASVEHTKPKWMEKDDPEAGLRQNIPFCLHQQTLAARENVQKFQAELRKSSGL